MRKLLPLLFAALLPLAACGGNDVVGPNEQEKPGSLSFSYSGDINGTFSVSGVPKSVNDNYPQKPFAVAALTSTGFLRINAILPTEPPKANRFGFSVYSVKGPKTVQICAQVTSFDCPDVFFFIGFNVVGERWEGPYLFRSGSVTISEITAERVRGSFQGTAVFVSGNEEAVITKTITITNGQFDVPTRNDLEYPL